MKVLYENPNNNKYYQWIDNNGTHDIWYLDETVIYQIDKTELPIELKEFLLKWKEKMLEERKTFVETYPVKLARITFIYKDYIYRIYPSTIAATEYYITSKNEKVEIEFDSLFEAYQREIRNGLEQELGIKYSKYIGFLD